MVNIQSDTQVYQRDVKEPHMVIDRDGVLLKIGEKEPMEQYYKVIHDLYMKNGACDLAVSLQFVQLPDDQKEIDKIFNNTGYAKRYLL